MDIAIRGMMYKGGDMSIDAKLGVKDGSSDVRRVLKGVGEGNGILGIEGLVFGENEYDVIDVSFVVFSVYRN